LPRWPVTMSNRRELSAPVEDMIPTGCAAARNVAWTALRLELVKQLGVTTMSWGAVALAARDQTATSSVRTR
jgi:hypothetical protein